MTCLRLESANTETARRTIELTMFIPKIGMCSNVRINRLATSGYKAKPEHIPDGEIPMHYRRKPV